jgi:hypothetical protein
MASGREVIDAEVKDRRVVRVANLDSDLVTEGHGAEALGPVGDIPERVALPIELIEPADL